ncbi:MAG TPA: CBS domain-containing protein [Anaerolineales bacterium]|nr:CBS domain-containing protein [Anaerolineales bacterium]
MHLLFIILDDLQRLPDLLAAWRKIGVRATLVTSQGGYRTGNWLDRVGLGGVNRLLSGDHSHGQRLLFSVVKSEALLEQAITEAERVVEGFDRPGSGIVFVMPVTRTLGLDKNPQPATPEKSSVVSPAGKPGFDPNTPISRIVDTLGLEPSFVRRNDSLETVVQVMLSHPSVNVVGVVSEEGRLIGLIDMASLSEALFFSVFPESYLAELHDVETVMEFVKRPHGASTAGDIMGEAEFVHRDDTLMKAFKVLQRRKLEGIPVVDEHNRPTGYIHLVEVMEACVRVQTRPDPAGADGI